MEYRTPAPKGDLFCSGNMMFRRASILVCVLLLLVHQEETAALNFQKFTSSTKKIAVNNSVKFATFAAALVCICGSPDYSAAAESSSLETQLKQLQNIKVTNQKRRIEAAELELQSKELLYPEGRLIGRGIVKLMPENDENKLFPYGLPDPVSFDSNFMDKRSTLIVLAVGRDGMPVAAKRMSLKDISFPYAFELNSDDLVFPYTPEAYLASENRKDSVALTVILSPDGLLASTEGVRERIGFALSEPVQVAGTFGRTTANIQVYGKIDTNLYSDSERKLLSDMDRQLDVIAAKTPAVVESK